MPQPIVQVDAFAERPFSGNPAAVCVLPAPREESWMRQVAMEMNLSETAFLHREDDEWRLRWFTPLVEVDLCGHATLASAHVLWTEGHLPESETARFRTRSGLLTARRDGDWIELDFPATPPQEAEVPAGLEDALGTRIVWCGRSRFDVVAELESEAAVRAVKPDFARLAKVQARGVIVTARAESRRDSSDPGEAGPDFVSRFFGPTVGVDEDPVTGSAHAALTPFWAARLGRDEMIAYQASARGGTLRVRAAGDRVRLAGRAVTVLRGELVD